MLNVTVRKIIFYKVLLVVGLIVFPLLISSIVANIFVSYLITILILLSIIGAINYKILQSILRPYKQYKEARSLRKEVEVMSKERLNLLNNAILKTKEDVTTDHEVEKLLKQEQKLFDALVEGLARKKGDFDPKFFLQNKIRLSEEEWSNVEYEHFKLKLLKNLSVITQNRIDAEKVQQRSLFNDHESMIVIQKSVIDIMNNLNYNSYLIQQLSDKQFVDGEFKKHFLETLVQKLGSDLEYNKKLLRDILSLMNVITERL